MKSSPVPPAPVRVIQFIRVLSFHLERRDERGARVRVRVRVRVSPCPYDPVH